MLRFVLAAALLTWLPRARHRRHRRLCATPEQAATVQALYATAPVPPTFMAATKLGIPEALVASAISGQAGRRHDRCWFRRGVEVAAGVG